MTIALTGVIFANDEYVVHNVSGTVVKEVSYNKWEPVIPGMILNSSTIVDIRLNSKLELIVKDEIISINQMKKGTVESFVKNSSIGGIRITGKRVNSNNATVRGNSNVSTASTRASDVTEDMEWEK